MLWGLVGPSTLAGVAVMILIIPVNAVMATIQRRLQVITCVVYFNVSVVLDFDMFVKRRPKHHM